jgi:hypothetical protein
MVQRGIIGHPVTFARWRSLSSEEWPPIGNRSVPLSCAVLIDATIPTAEKNDRIQ